MKNILRTAPSKALLVVATICAMLFCLSGPVARADVGDDTLKFYLSKSDLVVLGTITSEPSVINDEAGVANYICDFRVKDVLAGDVPGNTPGFKVNIVRFEKDKGDRHPLIKKDGECILFLKRASPDVPSWVTADPWFGVQPASPWLASSLKRLGQKPPDTTSPTAAAPPGTWSAADLAMREAMNADPSCTSVEGFFPQAGAVQGWQQVLQRTDVSKEQRAFAWWRIGSLLAYNFDQDRGERADTLQAEKAFIEARKLFGDFVCFESLNAASVYASLYGPSTNSARLLAEGYTWIATRSEDDIRSSARRINQAGGCLAAKFFPSVAGRRKTTLDEREQFLRRELSYIRKTIANRITAEITYSRDPKAIESLLAAIESSADPDEMKKWREAVGKRPKNGKAIEQTGPAPVAPFRMDIAPPPAVPRTKLDLRVTAVTNFIVPVPMQLTNGRTEVLAFPIRIENRSQQVITAKIAHEWFGGMWPPTDMGGAVLRKDDTSAKWRKSEVYLVGEVATETKPTVWQPGQSHELILRLNWPGTGSCRADPLIETAAAGRYAVKLSLAFTAGNEVQLLETQELELTVGRKENTENKNKP